MLARLKANLPQDSAERLSGLRQQGFHDNTSKMLFFLGEIPLGESNHIGLFCFHLFLLSDAHAALHACMHVRTHKHTQTRTITPSPSLTANGFQPAFTGS